MSEKRSEARRLWIMLLLGPVIVLVIHSIESRGSSSPEVRRLPPDLIEVANAQYAPLDGLAPGSREAQERQRQGVQQLGLPSEVKTAKTGIVFRLIPAGKFTMGSPEAEQSTVVTAERDPELIEDERQHEVTLTKAFYCGKFEVTQSQWERVMGNNPSRFKNAGQDAPVEHVSWNDCQAFLKKLCQMEGVPEGAYRLLTEAEWEYACRAGTETALYNKEIYVFGENYVPALDPIAWYSGNCGVAYEGAEDSSDWRWTQYRHTRAGIHPVGKKLANAFGIHDMLGNVREWCQDWYWWYPKESATDPLGPPSGGVRIVRGGSWRGRARDCRSAARYRWFEPDDRGDYVGFRVARTIP